MEKQYTIEGELHQIDGGDEGDFELVPAVETLEPVPIADSDKVAKSDSRRSLRRTMTMQEFIDLEHKEGSKATFLHGLFGKRLSIFFLLSCMAINSYVTEIINLVSTISPIVQQPAEIVLGESIAVSKKYKNDLFA